MRKCFVCNNTWGITSTFGIGFGWELVFSLLLKYNMFSIYSKILFPFVINHSFHFLLLFCSLSFFPTKMYPGMIMCLHTVQILNACAPTVTPSDIPNIQLILIKASRVKIVPSGICTGGLCVTHCCQAVDSVSDSSSSEDSISAIPLFAMLTDSLLSVSSESSLFLQSSGLCSTHIPAP